MKSPRRYALVGTGLRGITMFGIPLSRDFAETAELVSLCDPNPVRLEAALRIIGIPLKTFTDFDVMLRQENIDAVVVATQDWSHARYIVRALRAGKRVICEKPLCTTPAQCRSILAEASRSAASCFVTHNLRYGEAETTIRSIIRSGRIGEVRMIEFHEMLDRAHGADYFRRWHRKMDNSAGLLVHKASHHFDLFNWWAGARATTVTAHGELGFYGRRGPFHGKRCMRCRHLSRCPFYVDLSKDKTLRELYLEAEKADGYLRDGCVFDPSIDIYDTAGVLIRYSNDIIASYTMTAYAPMEGARIVITGTCGRLEYSAISDTAWAVGGEANPALNTLVTEKMQIDVPPAGVEDVPIRRLKGDHGGADPQLRKDHFERDWNRAPTTQMASLPEAAQAVLIGLAANKSIASRGAAVDVQRLLG